MQKRDLAILATSSLFRGVGVEELESLLGPAALAARDFRAGSVLLLAGCAYDSLWVLLEGSVSAEMMSVSGKTIRIESISAPEPLASAILFAPEPVLPVTVRALEDCRVLALPREAVISLCQRSRAILLNYLADSGARIAAFSERFRLMQFATLRERLADWLLRQAMRSGGREITLPSSKEKLAEAFGVTRPSLSRELGAMARAGLISVEGRRIAILRSGELVGLVEPLEEAQRRG
jgi:CRP/FNR family transcriptional regulator, dissimilatory nitrate respiration regulator